MADTTYIVLKGLPQTSDAPDGWEEFTTVAASSPIAAVKKTATDDGRYVAVPTHSWKPVIVEAVQTTVLKLS